ncbi:hypothetical protein AL755_04615 [Arthrobacter sp. ERGS1:01]|uniref:TetR/AcrR family transcriptional regulator n=1 Tax=Arthrobacter sp. ERGS1:01 TaxID=1704044 RepID=UPI0006B59140|nr:TetR/AcrR family transcriptional regulator [Arthrobacter sp. ERGS1:01]ALE04937.1 hypothetical protein AL755_04615 [Arthrobacter sp. ERGS1:01]
METVHDRRKARRQATIEEILDAAVELMARDGVGGMSLSGVARSVGMKPPSLYEYFPSKLALYDALFARGAGELLAAVRAAAGTSDTIFDNDAVAALRAGARAYVAWSQANPVAAELLNWRPVPGFVPTAEAYAPSQAIVAELHARLTLAVERGILLPAAATEDAVLLLTAVIAGVVSQQLANDPHAAPGSGSYARLLDPAVTMWLAHYTPATKGAS